MAAVVAPADQDLAPGPLSRELLERGARVLYSYLAADMLPLVMASKEGHTVTDVDGNVFLDLASASASVPLGAARPDIVEPAVEAIRRYGSEDSHSIANEPMFDLAERLVALAPDSISRVDIALNGTEAVETAIRLMRQVTGRPLILGFHGGYHGESTATATLGAEIGAISAGDRGLSYRLLPCSLPEPVPVAVRPTPARRQRRLDRRLHPR